jgi:hypothetical protein
MIAQPKYRVEALKLLFQQIPRAEYSFCISLWGGGGKPKA